MRRNALFIIGTLLTVLFSIFIYVAYNQVYNKSKSIAVDFANHATTSNIIFFQNKFDYVANKARFINGAIQSLGDMTQSETRNLIKNIVEETSKLDFQNDDEWIWMEVDSKQYFFSSDKQANASQKQRIIEEVREHSHPFITNPYLNHDNKFIISYILPVFDSARKAYIIGIDISLHKLHQQINENFAIGYGYTAIINHDKKIILHPEEENIGKHISSIKEYKEINFDSLSVLKRVKRVVHSNFLQLEVLQITTPLNIDFADNWLISVSIPVLNYMEVPDEISKKLIILGSISVLILVLVLYLLLGKWQSEMSKREKLEKEKRELELLAERQNLENLEGQIKNLKNQLNPHFLFNSFSSLYTLVEKDTELARNFVLKLSKLYRSLLLTHKENITALADELEVTEHYLYLQKIRFKEAIQYEIAIGKEINQYSILSQSLLSSVENCIKHNIVTKKEPLTITILIEAENLVIINNYNPGRVEQETFGTGQKNIRQRYKLLNINQPKEKIWENKYVVSLPLFKR